MARQLAVLSFVGLLAVGMSLATAVPAHAGVKNFMVVINGAQETPPNSSAAIGNGILTYDTATNTLCYSLSYVGALSGAEILAHIHGPAVPGVPAGVILALPLGNPKATCVVPAAPFDKKGSAQEPLLREHPQRRLPGRGDPRVDPPDQVIRATSVSPDRPSNIRFRRGTQLPAPGLVASG